METAGMDVESKIGENCMIFPSTIIGFKYTENSKPAILGNNCVIRSGAVIYCDVQAGDRLITGHNILIREHTRMGSYIVVGSNAVIDGHVRIGSYVKIETGVYIPTHCEIGSYVFIGPRVVLTNDKYPQKMREQYRPEGAIIEDNVSIGANSTILPGVKIGEGSFIAAGSVVTKDIPPMSLVKGNPGQIEPLPAKLRERNRAIKW